MATTDERIDVILKTNARDFENSRFKDSKNINGGFFSCEFFPPRTETGLENLVARAKRLEAAGAKFVSITWGAGGTSATSSLELAKRFRSALKVPTLLHLTCTNMDQNILETTLEAAKDLGIRNILALRGDPPRSDYAYSTEFTNAADLVAWIRAKYGDYFCIGVAGYPEGHAQGASIDHSVAKDLPYLVKKVFNGANFIITQLFYDPTKFIEYKKTLLDHPTGIFEDIPVMPGLMPVNSYKTLMRSAKLSSASIPQDIHDKLNALPVQDDEQVKNAGVEILCDLIEQLQSAGVWGAHFYTLNLEKSLLEIVHRMNLGAKDTTVQSQSWDDFTNGRYTDPDSAAFGEIDGYGPVVHGAYDGTPNPAWGALEKSTDISDLLIRHITNEVEYTPFNDSALNAETSLIQEELISLNRRDVWTLASQPAANAVDSTNKLFGWGPKGGKVYQYPFVEILISPENWTSLKSKIARHPKIRYYAINEKKSFETNTNKNDKTVVTWGKWDDSVQNSTIITSESAKAWGEELFGILRNWQKLYPKGSATYKLMEHEAGTRLLVTIAYLDTESDFWGLLNE